MVKLFMCTIKAELNTFFLIKANMNQNEKFEQGRGGRGGRGGGQQSSIAAAFAKSQVDFPPHQKAIFFYKYN